MIKSKIGSFVVVVVSLILVSFGVTAQQKRATMSGSVMDYDSGESLIGVTVYLGDARTATSTNSYGFYSLTLPQGTHKILVSYVGYLTQELDVVLSGDKRMDVMLKKSVGVLGEVIVIADGKSSNVTSPEMGTAKLNAAQIKAIPALMGEVDIIKAIQLLPGVQSTSEGSSGFSVRGGGYDQNLILLDEATVYNASHLMGFFSVFNNDAVKDVTLYKGDIPASFGGRLSSLLDIRTKDGNSKRFTGAGGIGLISSRITLEGPIVKEKASFLISGRRTYADLFLKLASDEMLRDTKLYFYDLNAKINWKLNDNNRIFVAGYMGKDNFGTNFMGMDFGNKTATLRWNHIFTPRLFSNITLLGSFYNYGLGSKMDGVLSYRWDSRMNDYGVKVDMFYNISSDHLLRFGYNGIFHYFMPGKSGGSDSGMVNMVSLANEYALEQAGYVAMESSLGGKLKLKYGVRLSTFSNVSNGRYVYKLDSDFEPTADSMKYAKGKFYHTRYHLEPRIGGVYVFDERHSVKASYARTVQYVQLASNSTSGSPLDVWFQSSPNVKPQRSTQYSIGYFRNLNDNRYELSVEFYYKDLKNVIDFRDHAELMANEHLEREVRFGRGYSYGVEAMVRKNEGRLTGWLSYTYARGRRQIGGVNDDKWYRSPYDKPHNISAVATYELTPKWNISASWVYASGSPATFPSGRYQIENSFVPIYKGRNESRYPDYHRLDVGATWQLSKPQKKFKSELAFSIYNAYGRKNPWTITFKYEEHQPDKMYAEQVYLFSFVPSVTWNFKF